MNLSAAGHTPRPGLGCSYGQTWTSSRYHLFVRSMASLVAVPIAGVPLSGGRWSAGCRTARRPTWPGRCGRTRSSGTPTRCAAVEAYRSPGSGVITSLDDLLPVVRTR